MLSIVIPTYNSEEFIRDLLESILRYDKETKIVSQIIIADDGSKDSTLDVVNNVASENKVIEIISKKHSNAGDARNAGLEKCTGEYVWFIDSDDIINPNCFIKFKEFINKYENIDIIEFCYNLKNIKTGIISKANQYERHLYLSSKIEEGKCYSLNELPELLTVIPYVWNKIYNINFIKSKSIKFSSTLVANDVYFKILAEINANNILFIKDALYTKVINRGSNQLKTKTGKERTLFLNEIKKFDTIIYSDNYSTSIQKAYTQYKFQQLLSIISFIDNEYIQTIADFIKDSFYALSPELKYFIKLNNRLSYERAYEYLKKVIEDYEWYSGNDKNLISVLITTYNLENYIKETLDSILNQDISTDNYDIVIVDDCSTDNTFEIIKCYQNTYSNIKLYKNDINSGFGYTINKAISLSTGKYVLILDGDDFVDPSFIRESFESIVGTLNEYVIFDYKIYIESKGKCIKSHDLNQLNNIHSRIDALKGHRLKTELLRLNPVPWRKIYSQDFIRQNNIRFPESRHLYGDNTFHWIVTCNTKRVGISKISLYSHRKGREGQSVFGKGAKFIDFIDQYNNIGCFLKENNLYEQYKDIYIKNFLDAIINVLPKLGSNALRQKFIARAQNEILSGVSFDLIKNICDLHSVGIYRRSLYRRLLTGHLFLSKPYSFMVHVFYKFMHHLNRIINSINKITWRHR